MKIKLTTLLIALSITINVFGQWQKATFPTVSMGQAFCITNNSNKLYVGTNDGVYYSADNGVVWTKISKIENKLNNVRVIVTKGTFVFVGTLDNGVFMTSDNKTWKQISKGFLDQSIRSIIIKDKFIYVGTGKGIYLTDNNGTTWKEINSGLVDLEITSLSQNASGLYATTFKSGVFHSTDNGQSWTAINGSLKQLELMGNKIMANDACIIYTNKQGIYISTDNGSTWKSFTADLEADIRTIYENNGTIYLGGSKGEIFYSKDNGNKWTLNQISSGGKYGNAGTSTTGILVSGNNLITCQNGGQLLWQNALTEFK